MEAAVASVTADFSAASVGQPRRGGGARAGGGGAGAAGPGRGRGGRGRGGGNRGSHRGNGSDAPHLNGGSSSGGAGAGGGGAGGGGRHRARQQQQQRNGDGAVLDLPAPATQITRPRRAPTAYRSQLSSAAPGTGGDASATASTSASSSKIPVPTAEELEQLSYRERLTVQLNTNSIDCPICINSVNRKQPIASCRTCSAPYHLKCLKDWAERSIAAVKEKAALQQQGVQLRANWRCPSCQTQYPEAEQPRTYWCFCGRTKDPRPSNLGNAHSCEKPCRRERPEGCTHSCPLPCHPAHCDPCNVMLRLQCHCGKEDKTIKCGTLHPQMGVTSQVIDVNDYLSCRQACDKLLGCGLHRCEKECHSGDCGDCELIREKTCYCGQEQKEEVCGTASQAELRHTCFAEESEKSWTGEWSCRQPSTWKFDCGIHEEASTERKICHPHAGPSRLPCPRAPSVVSTCACGQMPLQALANPPRNKCTDAIPSCGKICNKKLKTCEHSCPALCHEGQCQRCEETVTLVCRCGNEKKTMKCHQLQEEGEEELRCERICRALRACGRHECGRKCCPLAYQEANKKQRRRPLHEEDEDPLGLHVCDRICGRKLNCGQHTCSQPDHRGPCPPCLRSSFDEISCHCGATVLIPPVPCSTRIVCNQLCARPGPPCGHAKAPHACHEDDVACPPCPFLTERSCACGKTSVKNVRCSQANVSCGQVCGTLLGCGFHRCRKACHPPGECEACSQVCGKPRAFCGHPDQAKCHAPSKCSTEEPCPELVEAVCQCGNIKQRTRCGACNAQPESKGGKRLACAPTCAAAQRTAALAEAFGMAKDRVSVFQQASWLPETLTFFAENSVWCRNIEAIFLDFMKTTHRATHLFNAMKYPQRKFVHEMAEKFKLRSESLDEEPFRSVLIARKADSATPKPLLSEAWLQQYKLAHPAVSSQPKKTLATPSAAAPAPAAPVQRPKQELNCLYLESCFGYDEQTLKEAIAPSMQSMPFSVRWLTDEDVICVPKSSLSAPELTLKMRLVRTALRNSLLSCRAVDAAYFDSGTDSVTHREKQWTTVTPSASTSATPSGYNTPNAWQPATSANNRPVHQNAFAGLTAPLTRREASREASRPASPALSSRSAGSAGRGSEIVSNGLNRAPSHVVVTGERDTEVAENWEDEV